MKRKTGTREWAEHSANLYTGCTNGCRYCYARAAALRFGQIKTRQQWETMSINNKTWVARIIKRKGVTMFPTMHDLTPETAGFCANYLRGLLLVGNDVVLVSKPHPKAISEVLREIGDRQGDWYGRLLFRFTITASDDRTLTYWEPRAPSFVQRMTALIMVHSAGWRTSVSIEPMLDTNTVVSLVGKVRPFVTEDIWLGKMNHVGRRVRCVNNGDAEAIDRIRAGQTDERIMEIVRALKDDPLIRWKDSVREVIERNGKP